jgi:hypothetical protein
MEHNTRGLSSSDPRFCIVQCPQPGETGPKRGSNLTRQMRNEIDIALPSLAALAERVMPAVVNLSAALEEQAGAKGDENTESRLPRHSGGTARLSISFSSAFSNNRSRSIPTKILPM